MAIRAALELTRMQQELAWRIGEQKANAFREALTCDWGPPPVQVMGQRNGGGRCR